VGDAERLPEELRADLVARQARRSPWRKARPLVRLCHCAVVGFAVDQGNHLVVAQCTGHGQQRAVRAVGAQGAFKVHGGSRVDRAIGFDVVTLGDHRRAVTKERGRGVLASHATGGSRGQSNCEITSAATPGGR
jgi:hypothetical protein